MDSMIYKIHPQNQEKPEVAAEKVNLVMGPSQIWSIGTDYSDYVVVDNPNPGRTSGVSRLPAAEDIQQYDINHVVGGDTPITGFEDIFEKIGKKSEHCHEFDDVVGIAGKSTPIKDMFGYKMGGIRLVSGKWYPVGIGYHLPGLDAQIPPVKGSLFK